MLSPLVLAATPPNSLSTMGTIWDLTLKGGPVMIPIAIVSLVGLAIVIERLVSLRRARVVPPDFVAGLRASLESGPDAALERCRASSLPIARVAAAALERWDRPQEEVADAIAEAGVREAVGLRKNLRGLSVVVAVSPLLGLLGTIFGMIGAFRTVAASAEALGRTELLAAGIYEAMVTTAAGLVVAIPALLAYHWISAKADALSLAIDAACAELAKERAARTIRSTPRRATALHDHAIPEPAHAG
ncbi:MAG: MotA/TolQ/ExbB proton channel family protein [Phycisphaerae bacterium]|nr:MotA/TolQ/ExbB proton channel family protein [Phycisphaerae bacterium]